jgi:poly-beta-1,6-N-acetyl-D-glucosamine synthase
MSGAIFWICALVVLYTHAGYPLLLLVWARLFPRRVRKGPLVPEPTVSVIVAARNEERTIGERIENLLSQDYPQELVEIMIVSDGSTDDTNTIVERYALHAARAGTDAEAPPRVKLITHEANHGKPTALNAGLAEATGEIVVFTDARQRFEENAIRELVMNFSDPGVGAVSGRLEFREDTDSKILVEMGIYWNLERWIRRTESRIHSVVGATGAIYAVRRDLVRPIPPETILDDVLIPMRVVMEGKRTVYDWHAVAHDIPSKDLSAEKRRKIRTLVGNYQLFSLMPELLSPRRNPVFLQFVTHKLLRLFVPFFFIAFMLAAVFAGTWHRTVFAVTLLLLVLPLLEPWIGRVPALRRLAAISRTFVSLNWFAVLAFVRYIRPGKEKIW